MARRRRDAGIALPWENQGNVLGRLLASTRRRAMLAILLVVGAVFGLVQAMRTRASERATRLAIVEVEGAVRNFRSDHGRCPHSLDELVHPPLAGTRYLRETPRDGWGHPLLVRCPSFDDPDSVDVLAAGADGSFFDADVPR
jgi:type II secretory pathway pseudopilin PulG